MSPRVSAANREQYLEDRKQQILEAAVEVFGRKGFDGANVSDIAEAAGIGKGTIYLYFQSKEEIFRAILQENSFVPELLDVLHDLDAPIEEMLAKLARRYLKFMADHSAEFRLVLQMINRFGAGPSPIYTQMVVQGTQALVNYLEAQIQLGRVRPLDNPYLTARSIMGLLMTHVLLQEVLGGRYITPIDEEDWIREIIQVAMQGIRA